MVSLLYIIEFSVTNGIFIFKCDSFAECLNGHLILVSEVSINYYWIFSSFPNINITHYDLISVWTVQKVYLYGMWGTNKECHCRI